jgi:hypothetical protein
LKLFRIYQNSAHLHIHQCPYKGQFHFFEKSSRPISRVRPRTGRP